MTAPEIAAKATPATNSILKLSEKEEQVVRLMRDVRFGEVCIKMREGEPIRVEHMKKSITIT